MDIDSQLNAIANVIGYKSEGHIRFIRRLWIGPIIGIWVKGFPGNTTRDEFLKSFCVSEKKRGAFMKLAMGDYKISKAKDGDGYDVRFT